MAHMANAGPVRVTDQVVLSVFPGIDLLGRGFEEEGFAKAYLKINGVWRDHVLFGQVSPLKGPEGPDEGVSV